MTIRLIEPEEWQDLAPIFDQEGGRVPPRATSTAAVAYDEQGLAGFWALQQVWHAGPLWIRPDLAPIFDQEGGRVPARATSTAAVAYDEQGLAGFWALQQVWHAGPLWIRPDLRGRGLWRRLHAVIDALFMRAPGSGYYSFSAEPKIEAIFEKLGYKNLGHKVWAKETN